MHEFSLAQSVMATVAESARQESISRVGRATVVMGEWAAVLPDALRSNWEIITCDDHRFAGAELLIHQSPAAGACTAGTELAVDSYEGE